MTDARDARVDGLTPEAAQQVDAYFARVRGALLVAAAEESDDAIDELRGHILDELAGTPGTGADVTRVLAELGTPEALAASYAEAGTTGDQAGGVAGSDSMPLHGRLMGMPYELRVPTAGRIASRLWNPLDTRILVPRVFGLGWDINFGALAVKAHLIRPDDEDEPFATAPGGVITATLVVPLLATVALAYLIVVAWPTLPAPLPSHWSVLGRPDQFWDRGSDVAFLLVMSLIPSFWAIAAHVGGRPALNRVAVSAFATLLTTIALSQFVQVMFYVRGDQGTLPTFVGLAAAFVLPFVMFVVVSRAGRSAEQRRDLN